jgi:hypothetical protein
MNPLSMDTDGDGMPDNWEIEHLLNPYDARDASHDKYKTDATKRDTDRDGLPDNEELWYHGTNPTNVDTDSDGEEILGFGAAPIAPSRHALTYEEFISSNAYAGEYLTVKATVERIKHNPIPGNYSIFLESDSGKRGIVKVESSWHYDSGQHVDDRFGLSPRKGDTIVVVGIAKRICGSNRELVVDKNGKMYLVLSPEEARGRWLPSKRYVKVMYDDVTVVTPTPTPEPTPSPTPIAQAVGDRGSMDVEARTSMKKLFLYLLAGIVLIDVPILLYLRKKL